MMTSDKKFGMLRTILRALGLSSEAVDDIVDWIVELLAGGDDAAANRAAEYPYRQRDHFLSPAELHFFETLRLTVHGQAALCAKVNLGDLFWVKSDNQSQKTIYTNKIDRKHVDFVLCEQTTMRPLVAIELDDRSHQRADRQVRDAFVDQVFAAAGLPLLHIPARRDYNAAELAAQIAPYLNAPVSVSREPAPPVSVQPSIPVSNPSPLCPKCGSTMILRTARSGPNAGQQFWGCSKYPSCRGMLAHERTAPT